ncbi:opine metallophore biosynthesis dehydrogenase [Paenibacillus jiagnxiensis]|uniref:opine metallophore biosynthesis dehydrogenase n=1 Tax=Paenibacillus jiagnxiensis TaxID=3228926 RepID=UPI0033B29E94
MDNFNRTLILGTGPTTVQLAVLLNNRLNCCIGIAGRDSLRSDLFYASLQSSQKRIFAETQNAKHRQLEGECLVDDVFHGYETVTGEWDTVILSVTTDVYLEVLRRLDTRILKQAKCIILISPTFGSNHLVHHYINELQSEAEIISFSTYLGDTRWKSGEPSNRVITTGVKRKVFIGSTQGSSHNVKRLYKLFGQLGIGLEVMSSPIEAESRNISLYVHPPLFMNAFSLNAVFDKAPGKKYVYKLFPEGPITQAMIRDMLAAWKELTQIIERLGFKGVNLLKFMTDDNYPVRPESLSRHDIENFIHLEPVHQEYLLYIRYASLLIDPFSEPDTEGRYFDFSAVPIRQVFVNREGEWDVPRMPKEDYYRIKIIQGIARGLGLKCPTIDKFIAIYEQKLKEAAHALKGKSLSDAFAVQSFEEDVKMISGETATSVEPNDFN